MGNERTHDVPRDIARSFVWQQTTTLSSLASVAGRAMYLKTMGPSAAQADTEIKSMKLPSEPVVADIEPIDKGLLQAFDRWCDNDPEMNDGHVACHLFPQWSFPLMASAMSVAPFPLTAVLNQGAKVIINGKLPRGIKLRCESQLSEIVDDGKKYKLTSRVATGTKTDNNLVVGFVYGVVPHNNNKGAKKPKADKPTRSKPTVPQDAELLCVHNLSGDAGFNYALLSGDFNPIHSIPLAGRASGFPGCILHGFAQLSLAFSDVERACGAIKEIDVRFLSSLHLKEGAVMKVYVVTDDSDPLKLIVLATDGKEITMTGTVLLALPTSKL